jgi:hypothetical protein
MAEANAVTPPLQTAAATLEKAKLRKVLSRIDLVLFTVCAILGFDTVAASAEVGAQAITRLLQGAQISRTTRRTMSATCAFSRVMLVVPPACLASGGSSVASRGYHPRFRENGATREASRDH